MNVLLISECSGNALKETRRIIDLFAERRGERTWQTAITMDGLTTLRNLLRKTARKNTAVACHWIRGKDHSEFLWLVGDQSRFNCEGAVPTNTTMTDVLRRKDENSWHRAEDIRLLSEMAALFHDIGKANDAFQKKLKGACQAGARSNKMASDVFRHEWVSLRLFEAFVGDAKTDLEWLGCLATNRKGLENEILQRLKKDSVNEKPFRQLESNLMSLPVAKTVAWLILTHHRMPAPDLKSFAGNKAQLGKILAYIDPTWNDRSRPGGRESERETWSFSKGTPFKSLAWLQRVTKAAQKMIDRPGLFSGEDWLADPFVAHLSRLILMMSDHFYSSQPHSERYGDRSFDLYANTRDDSLNQRLDEHLIGVGQNVGGVLRDLMHMKDRLPSLGRHKGFKARSQGAKFAWQNRAYDLAESLRDRTKRQGFFGVNMASTGSGKTQANGRIMYALASPEAGARFSMALGLRTLTLQTGNVYREQFKLGDGDLAILIGGGVTPDISDEVAAPGGQKADERPSFAGSESAGYLKFEDSSFVHYDGRLSEGVFKKWLSKNFDARKLLDAPVLACTIDHLIPATEGTRGGQQIAPMLRLMSSDLVLDEVDDFGIDDLHAVARLVNWAGLLGSRVLLSSATLPPSMVRGLFTAYLKGREAYWKNCGDSSEKQPVCCAWFDEFGVKNNEHADGETFIESHQEFAKTRTRNLAEREIRRKAVIRPALSGGDDLYTKVAESFRESILELHRDHHVVDPAGGKRVSIGLIRMANVNPLARVARHLFTREAPPNLRLHLCCYHARYPFGVRTFVEQSLDRLLNRGKNQIFDDKIIRQALQRGEERDHVFVVLASPVAEVGRDHDYDWAIVEPSSMRSIIQLAGRVRRHREGAVARPNIHLMEKNILGIRGRELIFHRPGFEASDCRLREHGLGELITMDQMNVDSRPRILEPAPLEWETRLADLEHRRLKVLFENDVSQWLETQVHLTGFFQRKYQFRKGQKTQSYFFDPREEEGRGFYRVASSGKETAVTKSGLRWVNLEKGPRVESWCIPWESGDLLGLLEDIEEKLELGMDKTVRRFGAIELPEYEEEIPDWSYHPALGVFLAQ